MRLSVCIEKSDSKTLRIAISCWFQKQSMMVRQLEEELRLRMRGPSVEIQQQMEVLYNENEHLTREIAILRDTIKVKWKKKYTQFSHLSFYPILRIKILRGDDFLYAESSTRYLAHFSTVSTIFSFVIKGRGNECKSVGHKEKKNLFKS